MKKLVVAAAILAAVGAFILPSSARAEAPNRIGVGATYWHAVKDIDVNDVDKNGFSYLLSYQYVPSMLLRLEADLELFTTDFTGGNDPVWAPQAFVMTGLGPVYGGVGIGIYYGNGGWTDAPFYMVRAGLEFELLPKIFLDINANYRFDDWERIRYFKENVNTDTVRLGMAVRLGF